MAEMLKWEDVNVTPPRPQPEAAEGGGANKNTETVPLNNPWTFWVDRTQRGLNLYQYEANLRRIDTVETGQRFWEAFYNIPMPSALLPQSNLHMMRDSTKPVWEEEYNRKGGTFRIRVKKQDSNKVWKELLMAAVLRQLNEFLHENDEICGVSMNIRENDDCIHIWNENADLAKESRIFECLGLLLPDTTFLCMSYKANVENRAYEKVNNKNGNSASHGRGSKPPKI